MSPKHKAPSCEILSSPSYFFPLGRVESLKIAVSRTAARCTLSLTDGNNGKRDQQRYAKIASSHLSAKTWTDFHEI